MAFPERLVWDRLGMCRNTQRSVPFNVVLFRILEDFSKNKEMVPCKGFSSNTLDDDLLSEQFGNSKLFLSDTNDQSEDIKIDEFFTELAQWNEYLEKHVPYYRDAGADDNTADNIEIGGIEP